MKSKVLQIMVGALVVASVFVFWAQGSEQARAATCRDALLKTVISRSEAATAERVALRELIRVHHLELQDLAVAAQHGRTTPQAVEKKYQEWEDSIAQADSLRSTDGDLELSKSGCARNTATGKFAFRLLGFEE